MAIFIGLWGFFMLCMIAHRHARMADLRRDMEAARKQTDAAIDEFEQAVKAFDAALANLKL
jgi:hypothetical protein